MEETTSVKMTITIPGWLHIKLMRAMENEGMDKPATYVRALVTRALKDGE